MGRHRISRHSKQRMVERTENANNFAEAESFAKNAKTSGSTINSFQKYPKFFSYLKNKKDQTNDCTLRVYKGYIFIWRGKSKTLVTVHEIPERYVKEIEEINSRNEVMKNNESVLQKV